MPQGCAWGLFDRKGQKDHLGCLNLLTPSVVQAALKEARDGESVSLNWPINAIHTPGFFRKGLGRKVLSFQETPYKLHGFDEELSFNTQCSSQWDSLVHYAHQPSRLSYNGIQPSVEALAQADTPFHKDYNLPTLNHWHDRGGLVGRGVLLDYRAYADVHGLTYNAFNAHKITIKAMEAVIAWESVELRTGDILLVRSGFTRALEAASTPEKQKALMDSHRTVGVEGSVEAARWFWNHHFAAVAGDAIAFEQTPPILEDGTEGGMGDLGKSVGHCHICSFLVNVYLSVANCSSTVQVLHQYFLSLFGLNIGELWDLEALSRTCSQKQRYSFLLTSCPLNVPGSVTSPPNALAIF
ncbi:hypothetical protein CNMCM8927_001431 [Aspergillus lentulus]|uniref:Cyclase n=1 Tax=Aspergillus lentulus TaxID=293939 RepID=A0AAN6BLD9_ASPLE|nr:hypothetical protein CNMCM8060_001613 [Aspergillus lentulus]KAF4191919.1 hypothetical protein CNMCM8694_001090 [Aspergillus lentulus]KAF4201536.1 hypothetical protein CNMCM8927_001431 [Aspergillus lentulus]